MVIVPTFVWAIDEEVDGIAIVFQVTQSRIMVLMLVRDKDAAYLLAGRKQVGEVANISTVHKKCCRCRHDDGCVCATDLEAVHGSH
ncbi:MAG: hypothetical protein WC560_11005 [Syntrophales bacterium]